MRRILISKENLVFSRTLENSLVDAIPLAEVRDLELLSYEEHMKNSKESEALSHSRTTDSVGNMVDSVVETGPVEHLSTSPLKDTRSARLVQIQISTLPEGYNSGRTYYLRVSSETGNPQFVDSIRNMCATARYSL